MLSFDQYLMKRNGAIMEHKSSGVIISDLGLLGPQAIGSITPDTESEDEGEHTGSLSRAIRDRLHLVYIPTTEDVVASCIDGRGALSEEGDELPDAAGGSLALWIAFVLSGRDLPLGSFLEGLRNAGLPVGGHTDGHEHIGASGCGANDKLGHILELLSAGPSLARVVALTRELGVPVSDALILRLSKRADDLSGNDLLGTPLQRIALIEQYGSVTSLCGEHTEQLIIINTIPATTLDRLSLKERLGERATVFNIDAWAFENSLRQAAGALGEKDVVFEDLLVAMLLYNLATALVLCAPGMPLIRV
jgi:hypothetical protein